MYRLGVLRERFFIPSLSGGCGTARVAGKDQPRMSKEKLKSLRRVSDTGHSLQSLALRLVCFLIAFLWCFLSLFLPLFFFVWICFLCQMILLNVFEKKNGLNVPLFMSEW